MKILVLGGAGYIGSHTVYELIDAGEEVVIIDNLETGHIEAVHPKAKFYKGDLRDKDFVDSVLDQEKDIDAVIHFAGLKAVGESVEKPLEYYRNNVSGTINLLQVMEQYGCRTMIFSSSATVYGVHNQAPYREEMPTSATNPYGYTKVMIEQILQDLCVAKKDWSVIALRYFNPIGAHESGLLGENPNGIPNNLVPYIAQVALGKLDHLRVFGNDYDTPDGTGVRDYIHVMDLAEGHVKALAYGLKQKGFDPINLGTGKGSSVLDVVHA